jgi:hypothetical protein
MFVSICGITSNTCMAAPQHGSSNLGSVHLSLGITYLLHASYVPFVCLRALVTGCRGTIQWALRPDVPISCLQQNACCVAWLFCRRLWRLVCEAAGRSTQTVSHRQAGYCLIHGRFSFELVCWMRVCAASPTVTGEPRHNPVRHEPCVYPRSRGSPVAGFSLLAQRMQLKAYSELNQVTNIQ